MYLHYATVVGDFERVVEHWVMEEEWTKAIDVINRQVGSLHFSTSMLLLTSPGSPILSSLRTSAHAASTEGDRRFVASPAFLGSSASCTRSSAHAARAA